MVRQNRPQRKQQQKHAESVNDNLISSRIHRLHTDDNTFGVRNIAVQMQQMRETSQWMLMQKEHEAQSLRETLTKQRDELYHLSVQMAILQEKLQHQGERMEQEIKMIGAAGASVTTTTTVTTSSSSNSQNYLHLQQRNGNQTLQLNEVIESGSKMDDLKKLTDRNIISSSAAKYSLINKKSSLDSIASTNGVETIQSTQDNKKKINVPCCNVRKHISFQVDLNRTSYIPGASEKMGSLNDDEINVFEMTGIPSDIDVDDLAPPIVPLTEDISTVTGFRCGLNNIIPQKLEKPMETADISNIFKRKGNMHQTRLYPIISGDEDEPFSSAEAFTDLVKCTSKVTEKSLVDNSSVKTRRKCLNPSISWDRDGLTSSSDEVSIGLINSTCMDAENPLEDDNARAKKTAPPVVAESSVLNSSVISQKCTSPLARRERKSNFVEAYLSEAAEKSSGTGCYIHVDDREASTVSLDLVKNVPLRTVTEKNKCRLQVEFQTSQLWGTVTGKQKWEQERITI